MTTRSQKGVAAEQLVCGEIEIPEAENNSVENPVVCTGKSPRLQLEILDENKTSLRREVYV